MWQKLDEISFEKEVGFDLTKAHLRVKDHLCIFCHEVGNHLMCLSIQHLNQPKFIVKQTEQHQMATHVEAEKLPFDVSEVPTEVLVEADR